MPDPRKHVCRACGESYIYPVPAGTATRFHCEGCAGLDPALRRVLDALSRRLDRLQAQVASPAAGTAHPEPPAEEEAE